MNNSDVGVVVPVFDRARTVLDALESVAAQTYLPKRVVVIDDGSTDGTSESVHDWIDSRSLPFEIELVCQPNRGVSAARNRGLAEVMDCPLVAFLDSDDLWPSDFLDRTSTALAADPGAVAVTVDERYEGDARGSLDCRSMESIGQNTIEFLFRNEGGGFTQATLMRTAALCAVGAYDEQDRIIEDLRLNLKLCLQGRWLYAPGEAVTIRLGTPENHGERGHASLSHPEVKLLVAQLLEEFAVGEGRQAKMRPDFYIPILAAAWYRAGRDCMRLGWQRKAIDCFRKSKAWQLRPKTYLRIAESFVRLAAAPADEAEPADDVQMA